VSTSTQNQALSAPLFLYRELLKRLEALEALRLRVHDLNVQHSQITVRHGKGGKDRRTMLPSRVEEQLEAHLEDVRRLPRATPSAIHLPPTCLNGGKISARYRNYSATTI